MPIRVFYIQHIFREDLDFQVYSKVCKCGPKTEECKLYKLVQVCGLEGLESRRLNNFKEAHILWSSFP
jgi:hypothetical protein